jgi:hypothetical protein
MSDVVAVALITGATGVLGGLGGVLLAGRFARTQAEVDAQREHVVWLRNERYVACAQMLEEANVLAPRAMHLRNAKLIDGAAGTELVRQYVSEIEPMYRAISRIGVLGPHELEVAAGRLGEAAMQNQTAHLRGTRDEQRAGDKAVADADLAFRQAAQNVLGKRLT